jgi:hypothetical protein
MAQPASWRLWGLGEDETLRGNVEEQLVNPEEHIEIDAGTSQIPGLAYALTDSGIELPVLDITHPQFLSSIDESHLDELSRASMQ